MTAVVAIDLGTTGIKVAVVDGAGVVRSVASEVLPLLIMADGGVEQDPNMWWQALGRCARRATAECGLLRAELDMVAVTSQYMSTTPVDAAGLPLGNTIMWMDGRGAAHRRVRASADTTDRLAEVHGLSASPYDGVAHVDTVRALTPEVYAAAVAFVEPMDALAARLTGVVTATQHTMFPMLACDNRTWGVTDYSDELLALSGLPADKLPLLVPLGEPRGVLTADAAEHLGVAVAAMLMGATLDSATSAVGTGAIDATRCGVVIGTTAVIATHVSSKRHDLEHGLTSAPSAIPESWFLVAENGVGGKALDLFVNNLVFADDGLGRARSDSSYAEVLAAAAQAPVGSNGLMFLPWLVGSMAPAFDRAQRGGFVNLGLGATRCDMARAVLEGVALNLAWLLPSFESLAEQRYTEITFGGGGAQSALWGQIIADATGARVRRLARPSCTNAHGSALLALVDRGEFAYAELPDLLVVQEEHEPNAAAHELLAGRVAALTDFHDRMSPAYRALARRGG